MDTCKSEGLLLGRGGIFGNVIRIAPPLGLTRAQADQLIGALDRGLSAL
jgi:4-aminobutyrate aminotransferase